MMNKKNRMELSYNMQIAVDYDSGIILSNTVTQDPTDHYQLIPQIEHTIKTLGQIPNNTAISADNGYFTKTNLQYPRRKRIRWLYFPTENKFMNQKNIL